jgi:hypothetical protein
MIRIVWIALLCLLSFGAVTAFKAIIGPASSTAVDQAARGRTQPHGALAKADKLQVTAARSNEPEPTASTDLAPQSSVSVPLATPASPPAAQSATLPIIVSRHWHDPYAIDTAIKPTAKNVASRRTSKSSDNVRPRPRNVKPCRSDAVGTVLRSLKISSDCET